jgi:DNA repair protein RecN (Recombination protein N)
MLVSLTIRNLVLIDQLTVTLRPGFTVMTGETGAGKSVILNAIELATGMRGGRDLIRNGCDQASVTAVFDFDLDAPLWDRLAEQGIENEDMLVVRRVLSSDGKSRCFINDQPVTLALLRDIAGPLVEIHRDPRPVRCPDHHQRKRPARAARRLWRRLGADRGDAPGFRSMAGSEIATRSTR